MLKCTFGHNTYGRRYTEGWQRKQQFAPAEVETTSLSWIPVELVAVDWFYIEKISTRRQSHTSKAEDSTCPTVLVRQGAVSVP